MKKSIVYFISILSIFCMSVSFLSCDKDEDKTNEAGSLIGLWERTKVEGDGWDDDDLIIKVQFKSNGTMIRYFEGGTMTNEYSYKDGYLYVDLDSEEFDTVGKVVILTNTTLVIDDGEVIITFKRIN